MTTPPEPFIAITMGDPAGSGAELICKALANPSRLPKAPLLVVGDASMMKKAATITKSLNSVRAFQNPAEIHFEPETIPVLDLQNVDPENHSYGVVRPEFGKAAYQYIVKAVELCRQGSAAAIVTSAINKESLNKAGYHFDGHTGLLSHLCEAKKVTMMLVADGLRICHVSTHVSLLEAIKRVRPERILQVLQLADDGIRRLGVSRPRLAVAGLNPHAGEDGLFGSEERDFIIPALKRARAQGLNVAGPFAGDTVFFRAWKGEFDGVIAMYHDQGHVAAKMLGIWNGVNVTLGLPIIRTSVEHGTDFSNAGRGTSDPRSLLAAIRLAADMAS